MANRLGKKVETVTDFIYLDSKITKTLAPWKKNYDKPRQHIKKQRHSWPTKVRIVKAMVLPSNHTDMRAGQ